MKAKASLALWILTKFAIVFFIMALGAILMTFTAQYQQKMCEEQAGFIARQILGNINAVVTSGAEDEIKTLKINPTLSFLGRDIRYTINITTLPGGVSNGGEINKVIVDVVAPQQCASKLTTSFEYGATNGIISEKKIDQVFIAENDENSPDIIKAPESPGQIDPISGGMVYTFEPTHREFAKRLKYLVFLKCAQKEFDETENKYVKFLFIHGCIKEDPVKECLGFDKDVSPQFNGGSGTKKLSSKDYCGWD